MSLLAYSISIALLLSAANAAPQTTGFAVSGRALNEITRNESFSVPGAELELINVSLDSALPMRTGTADANGNFQFDNVPEGCYFITGRSEGMQGLSDPFCVSAQGESPSVLVDMRLETIVESIEVSASASTVAIAPTQTSSVGSVGQMAIDNAPKANRSFEDALPLIPGVFRGPSGEINSHGARASQSGIRLNGANVSDPFTGQSEVNLPADVVSVVEVLSSPYDAEYGGFIGAVSKVETKRSNMTKLNVALQNFNPRLRKRDGSIMGIESATPRLTLTGPIKKGKLAFLHSTEYQFVRAEQEDANLDPLARDVEREALSVFTQVDATLTDKNGLTINFLAFPEKLNFFGLNAFNPQEATPDLRRRGFLTTVKDVHQFHNGSTLISQADALDLSSDVKPRGFADYSVGLERATGAFFHRQRRNSSRVQVSELFLARPLKGWGDHQLKSGFTVSREQFRADLSFEPVTWLGVQDQLVRRLEFSPPAEVAASKIDYGLFLHDKWTVTPNLTLDLGLRLERDSIAARHNPSYRSGFAYSFGTASRTVFRGGAGLFFARSSLLVPTFSSWPLRTETELAPGGSPITRSFENITVDELKNPRSLAWSLQVEREVSANLFIRLGYQQRRTTHNYVVERLTDTPVGNALLLTNSGRDSYREWQVTARYRLPGNGHLTGSYVRSSAVGDLNDLGSVFGAVPAALIQPNEIAPLAFDAPHRVVVWADFGLPFDLRVSPVVEVRQGFPYSVENELRKIVGARNRGGRFPAHHTVDFQVTKRFSLTVRGKKRNVRLGFRMFNLMNSFNPQDVQSNIASPYFGTFYRGVKRRIRGVLEIGN